MVSELTEGTTRTYHQQAGGQVPRERSVTTLVTLYGAEDAPLADLRPLYGAAQRLADQVTHTLGGTPARVTATGPDLPVRRDPESRRPWCAVRFALKYRTGDAP